MFSETFVFIFGQTKYKTANIQQFLIYKNCNPHVHENIYEDAPT